MEKKTTKKDVLMQMLAVEVIAQNELFADFINHELELLEKKSANRKSAKTSKENTQLAALVLEVLADKGVGLSASEVVRANATFDGMSTPKMTSLLKILMEEGKVVRYEEGKKVFFKIATE